MNKLESKAIVTRLAFDLTVVESFTGDLEVLLEQLCALLGEYPDLTVGQHAAFVLLGPQGRYFQVAQRGMPPPWESKFQWDSGPFSVDQVADQPRIEHLPLPTRNPVGDGPPLVLLLPLRYDGRDLGYAVLEMTQTFGSDDAHLDFMSDLALTLSSLVNHAQTLATLQVRGFELKDARTDAFRNLAAAAEYRDSDTGWHIMRMANIAQCIAKAMGQSSELCDLICAAAPMHDVGKLGIPDAILLKPGSLSQEEFEKMKTHTEIGANILNGNDSLSEAARGIAIGHHERWDGTGYPKELKGEQIPLLARICSVADVFDALTSRRPYKEAWPVEQAIDWISERSGSQFDPSVVSAFEQAMPEILRIRERYRDDVIDPKSKLSLPPLALRERQWVFWDDSMSVGIDTIDEHHRYLFDLINDLFDIVTSKRGAGEIARVLKALEAYTKVHFQAEEQMMAHYGFEGLERQQDAHRSFKNKLEAFYRELHENPLITQFDMLSYLRDWLVHHIKIEDAKLRTLTQA